MNLSIYRTSSYFVILISIAFFVKNCSTTIIVIREPQRPPLVPPRFPPPQQRPTQPPGSNSTSPTGSSTVPRSMPAPQNPPPRPPPFYPQYPASFPGFPQRPGYPQGTRVDFVPLGALLLAAAGGG